MGQVVVQVELAVKLFYLGELPNTPAGMVLMVRLMAPVGMVVG